MNGPALIGILVAIAILGVIYAASDGDSAWPRVSFIVAGAVGILALDLPLPATILIFALLGAGLIAWRAFDRLDIGTVPWEEFEYRPRGGLGENWRERFGGDAAGGNWRRDPHSHSEAGYRAGARTGESAAGGLPGSRALDRDQALRALDLDNTATDSDVKRAHRRLMKKHHPDRGGSTDMATQLNRARELLLRQ